MEIMDESGIEIFVLPDCARCELAGRNPCDLNDCPKGFDVCEPGNCEYYSEEEFERDPEREYERWRVEDRWRDEDEK